MSVNAPTILCQPDSGNSPNNNEERKIKSLMKSVRSILNKITSTTKDEFIEEFLALHVSGEPPIFNAPEGQLAQVVDVIIEKAISEPMYCPLYVELCKRQVDAELKVSKKSPLRNILQNKCRTMFDSRTIEANTKDLLLKNKVNEGFDEFARRRLGNINLLCQLYHWSLISTKIIQWCLFDLLQHSFPDTEGNLPEPPYDEDSIHCATQLIELVGKCLEFCKALKGANIYLMEFLYHLVRIAPKCSPKIRFEIFGLKELRDNCWEQRKIIVGGIPKTIYEILL